MIPRYGITADQVRQAAQEADNAKHAAKLLGISYNHMLNIGRKHNIKFNRRKPRRSSVDVSEVVELAQSGIIRRDIAAIVGISPSRLGVIIREEGIAEEFTVKKGRAAWVARRGYTFHGGRDENTG